MRDRDVDGDGQYDEPNVPASPVQSTTVSLSISIAVPPNTLQISGGRPGISGNGRFVRFTTVAGDVLWDRNVNNDNVFDQLGDTNFTFVPVNPYSYGKASLSPTGRYYAYTAMIGVFAHVFLLDRDVANDGIFDQAGDTLTSQVDLNHLNQPGDNSAWNPVVSDNGQFVAFQSWSKNLIPAGSPETDYNLAVDVYIRDVTGGATHRISYSPAFQGVDSQAWPNSNVSWDSAYPALSGDGRHIFFVSEVPVLVAGDTNRGNDVFVAANPLAPAANPQVTANPVFINFGAVPYSSSGAPTVVTFTNTGNVPVTGGNIVFIPDPVTGQTDFNVTFLNTAATPPNFLATGVLNPGEAVQLLALPRTISNPSPIPTQGQLVLPILVNGQVVQNVTLTLQTTIVPGNFLFVCTNCPLAYGNPFHMGTIGTVPVGGTLTWTIEVCNSAALDTLTIFPGAPVGVGANDFMFTGLGNLVLPPQGCGTNQFTFNITFTPQTPFTAYAVVPIQVMVNGVPDNAYNLYIDAN